MFAFWILGLCDAVGVKDKGGSGTYLMRFGSELDVGKESDWQSAALIEPFRLSVSVDKKRRQVTRSDTGDTAGRRIGEHGDQGDVGVSACCFQQGFIQGECDSLERLRLAQQG